MSGVAVIRTLLIADAPLTALVPASRIMGGVLPINITIPAISITEISSVPRLTLAMTEPNRLHTERVQITVHNKASQANPAGSDYPGVKVLLSAVLAALPNQRGTIAGFYVDSVLPDQEGPDIQYEDSGIYSGSRDFIVKWKS